MNHAEFGNAVDQAQRQQLAESLAERGAVAQISSRHDDVVRNTPAALFHQLKGDRLLPLDAKWVDRVRDVDRRIVADFLNQAHAIVEVAVDLANQRAVVHALREFGGGDLSARHKDRALQVPRARSKRQGWPPCCPCSRKRLCARPAEPPASPPAVMPVSLKEPVGLQPWCFRRSALQPGSIQRSEARRRAGVFPSKSVTIGAPSSNGSNSR